MKFICDFMLGSLAKYLRMCNFDTIFIKDASDDELIKITLSTNRILLTRDKKLSERRILKNNNAQVILIKSNSIGEQILQLRDILKITFYLDLKRCIQCNTPLIPLEKEKIKDNIPFYIYQQHNIFLKCRNCKKIYWKGSHVEKMKSFFCKYLPDR